MSESQIDLEKRLERFRKSVKSDIRFLFYSGFPVIVLSIVLMIYFDFLIFFILLISYFLFYPYILKLYKNLLDFTKKDSDNKEKFFNMLHKYYSIAWRTLIFGIVFLLFFLVILRLFINFNIVLSFFIILFLIIVLLSGQFIMLGIEGKHFTEELSDLNKKNMKKSNLRKINTKNIMLSEKEEILIGYRSQNHIMIYFTIFLLFSGLLFIANFSQDSIFYLIFPGLLILIALVLLSYQSINFSLTKNFITSTRIIQIKRKTLFLRKMIISINISDIEFIYWDKGELIEIVPKSEEYQVMYSSIDDIINYKNKVESIRIWLNNKKDIQNIIETIRKSIPLISHPSYDCILLKSLK